MLGKVAYNFKMMIISEEGVKYSYSFINVLSFKKNR